MQVRFDGRRLWAVDADGRDVPFVGPAAERAAWAQVLREQEVRTVRVARDHPLPHAVGSLLAVDPNPPDFLALVEDYLRPSQDSFNHGPLREGFLDVDRFFGWTGLADRLRGLHDADVLVSGCGAGGSLLTAHAFGPRSVWGTEVIDPLAHLAKARTRHLPGVNVVRISGPLLPFADASFDLVESVDVLEHVMDAATYMREHARVLRPGGLMLLAVPNRAFPVEQHLQVAGPPWLPVRVADRLFTTAARVPGVAAERRERWAGVAGVRTHNISERKVRAMAAGVGLSASRVHRRDHQVCWPMRADGAVVEAAARLPSLANLAPTRQLIMALRR